MRILNLYSGIGGNRLYWDKKHRVTAVESNPEIAKVYKDLFPNDRVIITDAHKFLEEHHASYDFIWSSPPCQTHSQIRYNIGFLADRKYRQSKPVLPDLSLYEEIIFLDNYYKGLWVVENTVPFYKPLIEEQRVDGHVWWANFKIDDIVSENRNHRNGNVASLSLRKGIDISRYDVTNKRQILRNCVEPELGLHVLECAIKSKKN